MTLDDKHALLHRLDEARDQLEGLLPKIDPSREIYPGWTIRQMLAHITGWDDATIASLRAHVAGQPPATPADRGINEYNVRTVASRDDLDLDHVLKECRLTRQILRTILEEMPDDKFNQSLIVPWGGKATVTKLIDVFVEHEEEHAGDIGRWLKDPSKPLLKGGN